MVIRISFWSTAGGNLNEYFEKIDWPILQASIAFIKGQIFYCCWRSYRCGCWFVCGDISSRVRSEIGCGIIFSRCSSNFLIIVQIYFLIVSVWSFQGTHSYEICFWWIPILNDPFNLIIWLQPLIRDSRISLSCIILLAYWYHDVTIVTSAFKKVIIHIEWELIFILLFRYLQLMSQSLFDVITSLL